MQVNNMFKCHFFDRIFALINDRCRMQAMQTENKTI